MYAVMQEMGDEVVTWGLAAGPDNVIYSILSALYPLVLPAFTSTITA